VSAATPAPRCGPWVLVCLGLLCAAPDAHADELRTLIGNGAAARRLDLVVVAEGYREADKELFFKDANNAATGVLTYGPYKAARPLVNVHGLFVPSGQSGADHPSAGTKANTAFNATYDSGGLKRLITANDGAVLAAVTKALPEWDVAVLLVNDPQYGGSGGPVAIASVHKESIQILRHELAHTIAGLADEYTAAYPGKPVEDPEPNVALAANISPPKWHPWIDDKTPIPSDIADATGPHSPIGAYEGARYQVKGMFRPAPRCLMRELKDDFCPICWEGVYLALLGQTTTIAATLPALATVTCQQSACPPFRVDVAQTEGLRGRWLLDGKAVHVNEGADLVYSPLGHAPGEHVLTVRVEIKSDKVRRDGDPRLFEEHSWTLIITADPVIAPAPDDPPGDCGAAPVGGSTTLLWPMLVGLGCLLWRRRVQ